MGCLYSNYQDKISCYYFKENHTDSNMDFVQSETTSRAKTITNNLRTIEFVLNHNTDALTILRQENKELKSRIAVLEADAESWKELEMIVNRIHASIPVVDKKIDAYVETNVGKHVEMNVDTGCIETRIEFEPVFTEQLDTLVVTEKSDKPAPERSTMLYGNKGKYMYLNSIKESERKIYSEKDFKLPTKDFKPTDVPRQDDFIPTVHKFRENTTANSDPKKLNKRERKYQRQGRPYPSWEERP